MATLGVTNIQTTIGSRAISTVDFDSLIPAQNLSKIKKTKAAKECVNKIFADAATVIKDEFWIEKLNLASLGKFPRGFSYKDNILYHKKGARTQTVDISNNPYEAASAFMEFLRNNGGIFSQQDEENSILLQYTRSQSEIEHINLTWGDCNKKLKSCLISNYVIDMKKIMNLSDEEGEQLKSTIKTGVSCKLVIKTDIFVDNNRIQSINGLLWNEEKRIFYIDPSIKPKASRSYSRKSETPIILASEKDTIPQFGNKWEKYLEHLEKSCRVRKPAPTKILFTNTGLTLSINSAKSMEMSTNKSVNVTDD